MALNRKETEGGIWVTCVEAAALIETGKAWKAWFRPEKDRLPFYDNDPALVWLK